ncbi:MAG: hypothetical protein KC503_12095 [Myxococcales bacterium]|nr:hypothetical protein [Myxococcales bacterium]
MVGRVMPALALLVTATLLQPASSHAAGGSFAKTRRQLVKVTRTSLRRLASEGFWVRTHAPKRGKYAGPGFLVTFGEKAFLSLGQTRGSDALLVDEKGNLHRARLDARANIFSVKRVSILAAISSAGDGGLFNAITRIGGSRSSRLASIGKALETNVRQLGLSHTLQHLGGKPNIVAIQLLINNYGTTRLLSNARRQSLHLDRYGQLRMADPERPWAPYPVSTAYAKAVFGEAAIANAVTQLNTRAEKHGLSPIPQRATTERRAH